MIIKPPTRNTIMPAFALFLAVVTATGCGFTRDRDDALRESGRWFELVRQGKYRESTELLHPSFLESTTKEKYIALLGAMRQTYGEIASYSLTSWSTQSKMVRAEGSSALVILVFDVRCAKGATVIKLTCTRSGKEALPRILLMSFEGARDAPEDQEKTPSNAPEGVMI